MLQHNPLASWTKSSYSAVNGDCVEVRALIPSVIAVRDSKDHNGPEVNFTGDAWGAFVRSSQDLRHW